ncbi:hypothetical protein COY25_01875, partial [Candidatus Uhrbacteria bacterium CG_4_10_14_0_2_um_filter_41_7]
MFRRNQIIFLLTIASLIFTNTVFAGTPKGPDSFQLIASPYTGADNTGDGNTGAPNDLNYFYVGQVFNTKIQINSGGTTAANIWIDYDSSLTTASSLLTGTYFNVWSGQLINPTKNGPTNGRIFSTGAEIPVVPQTGTGIFGFINWRMNRPTAANYNTGSPASLDINTGVIGATTESNISLSGLDTLDGAEDFQFHVWADTVKPYATNPLPGNRATGVAVDSNYVFNLRDSLHGAGNDLGVGTGVNTNAPPGSILVNDGGGDLDYTAFDNYTCSGTWGTNLCAVTLNPSTPSGLAGDTRNWKYNTTYTVKISDFQDRASSAQDQLGDANGPNIMNPVTYIFTTEGDNIAPRVTNSVPNRGGFGGLNTDVVIDLQDRKSYPSGASGVGVDPANCFVTLSSPTFKSTNYDITTAGVSVSPIDFGQRIIINSATDFGQNETVTVSISGCRDYAGNEMTPDSWSFATSDTSAPYVDSKIPADDTIIGASDNISFHIKDSGVGVDLNETVFFVNGVYYTNGGGAGSVTTNGTIISFANSLDFNGGNYAGDTTKVTGVSNDYTFLINPQTEFVAGETVPIIIYAKDGNNNIMSQVVYGVSLGGGVCPVGQIFCGLDAIWNGTQCVGATSESVVLSLGSTPTLQITTSNLSVSQVDGSSVLVSWFSTMKGSSRVVYGSEPATATKNQPNYGYGQSTPEYDTDSIYHAVIVDGLTAGQLYYFSPVTVTGSVEVNGGEVKMAPRFGTQVI